MKSEKNGKDGLDALSGKKSGIAVAQHTPHLCIILKRGRTEFSMLLIQMDLHLPQGQKCCPCTATLIHMILMSI